MLIHASRRLKPPNIPRIWHTDGAPVAWFLMQRPGRTFPGDSGDVPDIAGNTSAGVRGTGCDWITGPRGAALACNGTGGVSTTYISPTTFTWYCRFAATSVPGNYGLLVGVAGTPAIFIHSDSSVYIFDVYVAYGSVGGLLDGNWHDVWATRVGNSSSGVWRLYVDGVYQISGSANNSPSNPLAIGYRPDYSPQNFAGGIDDVRVYNYALSPAQVAQDYADPFWRLRRPRRRGLVSFAGLDPASTGGGAILRRQRRQRLKPPNIPRLHHAQGAPAVWYLLNRPGGTFPGDSGDVADVMGRLPAGERSGAVSYAPGPHGPCLQFGSAGTGVVTLPSFPDLTTLTAGWTVTGWIRPDVLDGTWRAVITRGASTTRQLIVTVSGGYDSSPDSLVFWTNSTANGGQYSGVLTTGQLYHFAAVFVPGSPPVSLLYVNGVVGGNTGGTNSIDAAAGTAQLGNGPGLGPFVGLVDNIKLYSYPLSQAQVLADMADPFGALRSPRLLAAAAPGSGVGGSASLVCDTTLGATGGLAYAGGASLISTTTLSAAAALGYAGAAPLVSATALGAAGSLRYSGSASLACSTVLTASSGDTILGSAALVAATTLSADGALAYHESLALGCLTTLAAAGTLRFSGSASLVSTATLGATGSGGVTPGQPDPTRGTASRIGPDPTRGTAARA